jgi:hypothetical protein
MRHRGLLVCCLALSLGTEAFAAAPAVRVALHASEVVDATPNDAVKVHALVTDTITSRGANLAGADRVEAFLASRPEHSCAPLSDAERTQCLAELARGVDADRSVLVTVAPYAGERIILTAQVVSSGGKVLQEIEPSTYPRASKGALQQSIGTALHDFVPRLQIFEAKTDDPVTQPPSTASENPSVATQGTMGKPPISAAAVAPSPGRHGFAGTGLSHRTAGLLIGGVGLVLAGVGGYYASEAGMNAGLFNDVYRAGRPGIEDEARLASMRSDAIRSEVMAVGFIGAGTAAVIGGAFLLWTSRDAKPTLSSVRWLIAPASISVRVELP